MRRVIATVALAGILAAGEDEVAIELCGRPPIEGTLLGSAPLNVETRFGVLSIPVSDLLSIDPKEGLVLAHAGTVRGRFDWTELVVRTRYGDARLPMKDAVRIAWKRRRSPPKAEHIVEIADGTHLGAAITPREFAFATAYGSLKIPLSEVRLLLRDGKTFQLRLSEMTLRGEPGVEAWTLDTPYGALRVPAAELVRLSRHSIPAEGDRVEGGYIVRTVGAHGGSFYAVVTHDEQMTWPQAKEAAERMGGHLAAVGDASENEFLCGFAERVKDLQPWIGFSDEDCEGEWRWVTGEPVSYTNWGRGEPNNAGGGEDHCEFLIGASGRWNDVDGRTRRAACLVEFE